VERRGGGELENWRIGEGWRGEREAGGLRERGGVGSGGMCVGLGMRDEG